MAHFLRIGFGAFLIALAGPVFAQTPSQPPPEPQPILRDVRFEGLTAFGIADLMDELGLRKGEPMPRPPAQTAERLERHYRDEEYSYAKVTPSFDTETGTLTLKIDEGRIDEIEFEGIDPSLAKQLLDDFDVRPGDIFNRRAIRKALNRVLAPTQGAIERAAGLAPGTVFHDVHELEKEPQETVQLVDLPGRRVLVVHLQQRIGRFQMGFGTEGREDWFTPVDGFSPALSFTGTVFNGNGYNHTVITGFASYKFSSEEVGYAVGFERPLFRRPMLYLGGEIFDVTASDDLWRLSRDEQSLVALGFKNTFRDYYDRRGFQTHAALRLTPNHEAMVAFRHEHQEPLRNETDYSFFRDDNLYRPNLTAAPGVFQGLVLGYTFDSRTFDRASLARTYRRHQMDDLYGSTGGQEPGYRVEWTSEISDPETFGGDFDFRRHILNARAYTRPSPHQFLNARVMAGFSGGTLPPQRTFALGGIGSVRGYSFKEVRGERMFLVNAEYKAGLDRNHVKGVIFFDAGTVGTPLAGRTDEWLKGVGVGVEFGTFHIGFGWRLDDIPKSLQVLVRFSPLF